MRGQRSKLSAEAFCLCSRGPSLRKRRSIGLIYVGPCHLTCPPGYWRKVIALRRRSKYILADLDSGETLIVHLGMSGRIQISGARSGNFITTTPPRKNTIMLCSRRAPALPTMDASFWGDGSGRYAADRLAG